MPTIAKHVATLRSLLHNFDTSSKYTDKQLYLLFNDAVFDILRQSRFKKFLTSFYRSFCVTAIPQKKGSCISFCDALVTDTIPLPATINGSLQINIMTKDYSIIDGFSVRAIEGLKHNSVLKNKIAAVYLEGKIYIFNHKFDKIELLVTGLWNDITEWVGRGECPFDIDNTEYPVTDEISTMAYHKVLDILRYKENKALNEENTEKR